MNTEEGPATGGRPVRRAVVVGLGLIGSSLGLGLRSLGYTVTGSDLDAAREQRALELGVVDEVGEDPDAELAFVATPVGAIAPVVEELFFSSRNPDLVITDVGGVKSVVVEACTPARFVGGHPMAGSEQAGPDGADRDLFAGANWVLTPIERTDPDAYQRVRAVVRDLGAEVLALTPERHDALVAVVSHVPHLTAATLMALAAERAEEHGALLRLAAGGFRDMTRIAAGDPGIWPDIFGENAEAVLSALDELRARLDEARRIVAEGDRGALIDLLDAAKVARRNLPARPVVAGELCELRVPVPDRPGVLAEVTTVLGELGVNVVDLEIAHSLEGERGVLVVTVELDVADKARRALIERGYRPGQVRL